MGPMFPRLHVNDTEKGGPRAPPRNKMALYEQLSIPSQRFKPNLIPPSFSSQGNGHEMGMLFPLHLPSSRNSAEKSKPVGDDSRVCIFVNSSEDQGLGKLYTKSDWEKPAPPSPAYSVCPNKVSKLSIGRNVRAARQRKSQQRKSQKQLDATIDLVSDTESQKDEGYKSLQTGNVDPGEDSSETSMVDCISQVDMIPDDIVGVIGKNHFWKARRSIMHQQRLFALQVFELHRLIKVQKLIAASPNLLEGSAYLAKSLKGSSAKSLPLEYIVEEPQNVSKHENDFERMEFSAENTTKKTSFSSVQNGSQRFSGNPTVAAISNDYSDMVGPWCFHHPAGQQWLIPVMTPSEGLVYKQYPGPSVYGSPGPFPIQPSRDHYQGTGVPFAPPAFNGNFPPYGMPGMNPANSNTRSQKKTDVSNVGIPHPFIENERQVSTASTPSEKSPGIVPVASSEMEVWSALRLPSASTAANHPNVFCPRPRYADCPTRVIRAVPRNPRSASESAARIFQSIQEERKQYD